LASELSTPLPVESIYPLVGHGVSR
jgi:hypothetical protein